MNFQVELTSHCDLTCGYCPNKDMQRKRAFMAQDVWEAILHEYIVPYRHINSFSPPTFIAHKDGEPLLNKRLPHHLRELSVVAPDMKIDIYSHGLMLPKWKNRGEDFIEFLATLPNNVRYMMSYHPYNHDGSVNVYSETIDYLRNVLRDPPKNVEFITVSHKSKWVTEELQTIWELMWEGYPITVHKNCHINPWTGRIEEATCHYNGCPYADFGHWFFGATGNIIACCLDLEEEIILGNVLHDSPGEMFFKTNAFYIDQREGRWKHQVCADCYGEKRYIQLCSK
jgi:sulfatase maturation enzyme AslB (radical SAM superfamily)